MEDDLGSFWCADKIDRGRCYNCNQLFKKWEKLNKKYPRDKNLHIELYFRESKQVCFRKCIFESKKCKCTNPCIVCRDDIFGDYNCRCVGICDCYSLYLRYWEWERGRMWERIGYPEKNWILEDEEIAKRVMDLPINTIEYENKYYEKEKNDPPKIKNIKIKLPQ
jgi:hypothetical protein